MTKKLFILVGLITFVTASLSCGSALSLKAGPEQKLKNDIDYLLNDPNFFPAHWGVVVESLDSGEILFRTNEYKFFIPASNMKLFTSATALDILSPEFHYETGLNAYGSVTSDGLLKGNLVIVGSGDPSLGSPHFNKNVMTVFEKWAEEVKNKGIKSIEGEVLADASIFDNAFYASGWEIDDLPYWYAAPVSGLTFHENTVKVKVIPAFDINQKPDVAIVPETEYFTINNSAVTIGADSKDKLSVSKESGSTIINISGTISTETDSVVRIFAVQEPVEYTKTLLTEILQENGITVEGRRLDEISDLEQSIAAHKSPALKELLLYQNKVSHNLIADHLFKTIGVETEESGSFSAGSRGVKRFLASIGVNSNMISIYDGSGLSRHNLVMPVQMSRLLSYMDKSKYRDIFNSTLPIAGVDGTINSRMIGTTAENRVIAKTGTVHYVSSLSGYVNTYDNERLAVTIFSNNFLTPTNAARLVQDKLFILLTQFSRK